MHAVTLLELVILQTSDGVDRGKRYCSEGI